MQPILASSENLLDVSRSCVSSKWNPQELDGRQSEVALNFGYATAVFVHFEAQRSLRAVRDLHPVPGLQTLRGARASHPRAAARLAGTVCAYRANVALPHMLLASLHGADRI